MRISSNKKMRHSLGCGVFVLLFIVAASSPVVMAQTARYRGTTSSTIPTDSGTTPAVRQQITEWRQSSDLQPKIAALGTTPVASLPMPALFGVSPSDLSPNFGIVRASGHTHEGEDIMAVKGTPIVSPTAAVVLRLEQGASEGNGIYTINPGGETFVYYHLDHYAEGIAAGQVLEPGSLIGYVGNTGDAAGGPAHIHFEIHDSSGTPIDPFPRLTGTFTPEEKIVFLSKILTQTTDSTTLARFLVTNFRGTFLIDLAANIALPLPIIDALASVPITPAAVNAGESLPAGDLDIGSSGAAVVALQQYLIQAASGDAATRLAGAGATGNFGIITKAALLEFQVLVGIAPASGYYGPVTRAYIAAHPLQTSPLPAGGGTVTLSRDLYLGMSGEDVRTLQTILNAQGFTVATTGSGSSGNETTYFGPATKAAVIRFQIAHDISPTAGYVGPLTRTALSSL
jgi:peptidoglycan hydrolase-like protein with peptidoglycan-binding domain